MYPFPGGYVLSQNGRRNHPNRSTAVDAFRKRPMEQNPYCAAPSAKVDEKRRDEKRQKLEISEKDAQNPQKINGDLTVCRKRIGARERVSGNTSLAVCTIRFYYRLRISFAGRDATYHPLQRTRKISSKEKLGRHQAENSSISISVFYLGFPWM